MGRFGLPQDPNDHWHPANHGQRLARKACCGEPGGDDDNGVHGQNSETLGAVHIFY
jgi:hypothetical protein